MPIFAKWRCLEKLPKRRARDAQPGIYELADKDKQIIYIGQSAKDVPNRIRQHFTNSECIIAKARYWRYQFSRVPKADEAKQLEIFNNRFARLPLCNRVKPLKRDLIKRYSERSSSG